MKYEIGTRVLVVSDDHYTQSQLGKVGLIIGKEGDLYRAVMEDYKRS